MFDPIVLLVIIVIDILYLYFCFNYLIVYCRGSQPFPHPVPLNDQKNVGVPPKLQKKNKIFEYHQICKLMRSCNIFVRLNLFCQNYFIIFVLQMKKLPLLLFKHCNLSAYHRLGPPGLLYVFAIGILF